MITRRSLNLLIQILVISKLWFSFFNFCIEINIMIYLPFLINLLIYVFYSILWNILIDLFIFN